MRVAVYKVIRLEESWFASFGEFGGPESACFEHRRENPLRFQVIGRCGRVDSAVEDWHDGLMLIEKLDLATDELWPDERVIAGDDERCLALAAERFHA